MCQQLAGSISSVMETVKGTVKPALHTGRCHNKVVKPSANEWRRCCMHQGGHRSSWVVPLKDATADYVSSLTKP